MPAPSTVPSWATDPVFTSGTKAGSPTKVVPSAGAAAQGDIPGDSYRSERHNWVTNLLCGWASWLSTINTQADFLNRTFNWTGHHAFTVWAPTMVGTPAITAPFLLEEFLNLSTQQSGGGWQYTITNGHLVNPASAGSQVHIPIAVPSGNDLVNFKVGMRVGGGTATVSLLRFTPDESPSGGYSAPTRTVLATTTQAVTTAAEVTLSTPISHSVNRLGNSGAGWYVLEVVSGSTTDAIYYAKVIHRMNYVGGQIAI